MSDKTNSDQAPDDVPDEITLKIDYVRTFNCGICKKPLTATKILNGHILDCGCGSLFTRYDNFNDSPLWEKVG